MRAAGAAAIVVAGALIGVLAACAVTPPAPAAAPPALSASQRAVQTLKQEYLDKFLTPATAYAYSPRCPRPAGGTCSDPDIVGELQKQSQAVGDALGAAQSFADAAPQADASGPLAAARQALTAAEAALPGAT